MVGIVSFAICLGTLAVYGDSLPAPAPATEQRAPETAAASTAEPIATPAPAEITEHAPAQELNDAETLVDEPESMDEPHDAQAIIDMERLAEEIRQRELKEAQELALRLEMQRKAEEAEALAALERQKEIEEAQAAALRERQAREKADNELKALRAKQKTANTTPQLPPPVPAADKKVASDKPVARSTAAKPAPEADLNSSRSLWEYIPPAESVREHEDTETWRELQGTTPLHIQSSAVPAAQAAWNPVQPAKVEMRVQLIQGDMVWVSVDRKKTEQIRVGQRHPTLGQLKSINGNIVNFEKASLPYTP